MFGSIYLPYMFFLCICCVLWFGASRYLLQWVCCTFEVDIVGWFPDLWPNTHWASRCGTRMGATFHITGLGSTGVWLPYLVQIYLPSRYSFNNNDGTCYPNGLFPERTTIGVSQACVKSSPVWFVLPQLTPQDGMD